MPIVRKSRRYRARPGTYRRRGRRGVLHIMSARQGSLARIFTKPHFFRVSYLVTTWVGGGSGSFAHLAYAPTLADIPGVATFQAMFDQYRIFRCDFKFEPGFTGNDTNGTPGVPNVMSPFINSYVRCVKDYDDTVPLTSENDYFEYDNLISFPVFGKGRTVSVYPRMKLDNDGNNDISFHPKWIDTDNINVPHYGIKCYAPISNSTTGYTEMRVVCSVIFACKNQH